MLTHTNYGEWAVTMKVKLRARRLWNAIDKGTNNEEDDMSALEAILAAVPAEYREPLGAKSSAKEAWEAIATMRVGFDRTKKATAQLLKQEYTNLKFKDSELVEDFSLCLQTLISKLRSHSITIDEEETVSKYLHSVPVKYIQIAHSIAHGAGHGNDGQRQATIDRGGVGCPDEGEEVRGSLLQLRW